VFSGVFIAEEVGGVEGGLGDTTTVDGHTRTL